MISLYKTKIERHVSEITVSEIIINTFDFFFYTPFFLQFFSMVSKIAWQTQVMFFRMTEMCNFN